MKRIKQFSQILLIMVFLSSCRTSSNKEYPIINSEENINENNKLEKTRMEIKFSCVKDEISKYLEDGWIILKKIRKKKFVLGNLFLLQKVVIWKKIKDVK